MNDIKIIKKLGSGSFSKVFLVKKNKRLVAMKTTIPSERNNDFSLKEINILEKFKDSNRIVNLIDYEINNSTNKIYLECLGDELFTVIDNYRLNCENIPIKVVKRFTKQLLEAMIELEDKNILHNDLKPENILFTEKLSNIFHITRKKYYKNVYKILSESFEHLPGLIKKYTKNKYKRQFIEKNDLTEHINRTYSVLRELLLIRAEIKLSDFGNSLSKQMVDEYPRSMRYTIATRYYRSPETLLKLPYWVKSDMWSVACIICELLTNEILFDPYRDNDLSINSFHLAIMIKTFGDIPPHILIQSRKLKKYFIEDNGKYVHKFKYLIGNREPIIFHLLKTRSKSKEVEEAAEFLESLFIYDSDERLSPKQVLQLKWLK